DDFRNVEPGLHVKIRKGLIRVGKNSWIIGLQIINHVLNDRLGRVNLVGLLRWNVVECVLVIVFVKVVTQLFFQLQELLNGIVEDHFIKKMPIKMLLFSTCFINIVATITKETELPLTNPRHFFKDIIFGVIIKVLKG